MFHTFCFVTGTAAIPPYLSCLRGRQVDVIGQKPLRGLRFKPQHGACARTMGGQESKITSQDPLNNGN